MRSQKHSNSSAERQGPLTKAFQQLAGAERSRFGAVELGWGPLGRSCGWRKVKWIREDRPESLAHPSLDRPRLRLDHRTRAWITPGCSSLADELSNFPRIEVRVARGHEGPGVGARLNHGTGFLGLVHIHPGSHENTREGRSSPSRKSGTSCTWCAKVLASAVLSSDTGPAFAPEMFERPS